MTTNPDDTINPIIAFSEMREWGLTKREYFAAMAMQGWLAGYPPDATSRPDDCARRSVEYADELIKALNQK